MNSNQDPYSDIRPYKDTEVSAVLDALLHNNELVGALSQYKFPKFYQWLPRLTKSVVRIGMARQFGDIETVRDFQSLVAEFMQKMIGRTTSKITCSGIENLQQDGAYLFISNHRDIAMDPAFVNWMLYHKKMQTVRIAIGDNLLKKEYVSDLMRLNKSFIVKRSAKAPREMMKALTQLSSYIDHSVVVDEASIWIAQREGRAKDGDDKTDAALLKMLYMSQRKQRSFAQMTQRLNIVPVSISYEFDPCDNAKAKELAIKAAGDTYIKSEFEDIESIVAGITGFKGQVHVHFGDVLAGDVETPAELALVIDEKIQGNYKLHDSNLIAAGQLENMSEQQQRQFESRFSGLTDAEKAIAITSYAKPYFNQQQYSQNNTQENSDV
ncbi:MAG: 1-acyl-sn-glycerol-3-phosphate acyltransferase [Pseudomonadales bacterium]|nr:1-acyl-sn-glycerol-3-phosphate acyltransferase [Pseudomonadales bacterium]NRA18176.1 1-acyl-sn-glycerol-3-phosphate acyltransferase [Oceanospirillaceae bacterium]